MNAQDLRPLVEQQLALSRRLKARIKQLEDDRSAPLAVVGLGMRFPGGITTPEQYWDFLTSDRDAVREIPEDRKGLRAVYDAQRDKPGASYVQHGCFLDNVDQFDARFFGISNREAEALDPQQRLLLETAWEAMERAGIPIRRGDRLPVGVFVGIMASEYGQRRTGQADKTEIDPYFGTGGGHCFAAGRVSYAMGFSGPAISVDTACSSSLVALHLAAQSLRQKECRYAIVGGTNLMFSGDLMISLCQSGALAPDGRCKTFTKDADGYGRGEGIGALALMRLSDAEADGHPILAVLRGTATNHDGASSGLTVPNGAAQRDVIKAALVDGRIDPTEIGMVEAHGTGTELGDPIEANALDAVLGTGAGQRSAKLCVGNVKTRIGHLEAAAGIAGVMKVVLALKHGTIPAALRDEDGGLSEMIPWRDTMIDVPRAATPWPDAFDRRLAGVSAFGLSGTNAHAIFEAPEPADAPEPVAQTELVVLSARDGKALQALAQTTAARVRAQGDAGLAAVAHTLRAGRSAFACRSAVIGGSAVEIAAALDALPAEQRTKAEPARMLLRVGTDADAITAFAASLAERFPALATGADPLEGADAASHLHRMIRPLVPRARLQRDAEFEGVALEWNGMSAPLLPNDGCRDSLLSAMAQLFEDGADLRLEFLAGPGQIRDGGLPTYPFRRERYWIDEPTDLSSAENAEEAGAEQATVAEAKGEVSAFVEAELVSLLRSDEALDQGLNFLDVGGDSFIAMLLKKAVEQRYEVDLPPDLLDTALPLSQLFARIEGFVCNGQAVEEVV